MPEGVLTILKFCLFVLLYLFLARVVWVVTTELRGSAPAVATSGGTAPPAARPSKRKVWRLIVAEPPDAKGTPFAVEGEITLGRAAGCRISMPRDTFVSQVHARVFERDGDVLVEDLASTNGTFVNGKRVTPHDPLRLKRGDRLQVGETVLEVSR